MSTQSRTRITFDLADILTSEEISSFQENADNAQAASLTEHFLNITLRKTVPNPPAPVPLERIGNPNVTTGEIIARAAQARDQSIDDAALYTAEMDGHHDTPKESGAIRVDAGVNRVVIPKQN